MYLTVIYPGIACIPWDKTERNIDIYFYFPIVKSDSSGFTVAFPNVTE